MLDYEIKNKYDKSHNNGIMIYDESMWKKKNYDNCQNVTLYK